jgi:hypothetical protein
MDPSLAPGKIPPGYREVLNWRIPKSGYRIILLQVIAGGIFLLSVAGFLAFAFLVNIGRGAHLIEAAIGLLRAPMDVGTEIGHDIYHLFSSGTEGIVLTGNSVVKLLALLGAFPISMAVFLLIQILVIILHEGVHGVMILLFGARLTFGIIPSGLMVYASSPGHAFPRNAYLWIAIMPLLVLDSLVLLLVIFPIGSLLAVVLAVAAALNTAGAIGDVWIASIARRYPVDAYVIDEKDGMRIFLPEENPRQDASGATSA